MSSNARKPTGDMTTKSLVIRGREYTIVNVSFVRETRYHLRGARGAKFFTMRNMHNPSRMFIVPESIGNKTLEGVWLSDENNVLKVVSE
jgi:hypothetical protein